MYVVTNIYDILILPKLILPTLAEIFGDVVIHGVISSVKIGDVVILP